MESEPTVTEFGPESQPTVTMPGYRVYREEDNPSRFRIRAEATGKTAGISPDIVVKLAVAQGAVHYPGLPRNSNIDRKVERLRQNEPWEAEYGTAAILAAHGVAYKLMPDTFPVSLEAFNRAAQEVRQAHMVLMEKQRLADAAWKEVMASAGALPEFADVEELGAGRGHACLESPVGVCLYDDAEEYGREQCLVCGLPEERD